MRAHKSRGKIYVLWAEGTNRVKIGYTARRIGDRCVEIATTSPLPLKVFSVFYGGKQDEQLLHAQLRRYRTHHEWFELPEDLVWKLAKRSLQWPETPDKLLEFNI